MEELKEEIKLNCKRFASLYIGDKFTFREHQLETIVDIIYNILSNNDESDRTNQVIEAPTGSGKSIILIISAGVLLVYYKITSYILCSDLSLFEQYDRFIKSNLKLRELIGAIKGQTGNYQCSENKEDIRNAECRMCNISWAKLMNPKTASALGFDCAKKCHYVKVRSRATKAGICVMTYQLFLFMMNNSQFNQNTFKQHDVLFCDECHNVPSIVQEHYSATIKLKDFDRLCDIYNGIASTMSKQQSSTYEEDSLFDYSSDEELDKSINNIKEEIKDHIVNEYDLRNKLIDIWHYISEDNISKERFFKYITDYAGILNIMGGIAEEYRNYIYNKKNNRKALSKNDVGMFKLSTWHENYMCHWNDMAKAISETSIDNMVYEKNISNEDNHMSISLKSAAEDYLVSAYLLSKAPHKVFTSATVGDIEAYDFNMGFRFDNAKDTVHMTIPSTFDFKESPIYVLNGLRMSYDHKDKSFVNICKITYDICNNKFKNSRGLIQTGSYEIALKMFEDAPLSVRSRMLVYNGNVQKDEMMKEYKNTSNKILIGPTLNEGIDLPGELCEFIIIIKVPFPNLTSKLVKAKMKLFPLWYNASTSNNIIQGIGRGVRFNGDKCITYILDGCFYDLFKKTRKQYPYELQKRIKFIN